jgi:hypothetical protein
VSNLDRAHSRRRSGVVIGPFDLPAMPTLVERYSRLVDAGPPMRVCLEPSVRSSHWRRHHRDGSSVVGVIAQPPGDHDPALLLPAARTERTDDVADGIRILCAGDYLAMDFCHGLGEVPLVNLILDVLFGATDPSDPALVESYRHRVSPLTRALLGTFGSDPRRVAALLRHRGAPSVADIDDSAVPFTPRPTTSVVGLPDDVVADLRARRDAALPGVSLVALCTRALWECLADTGLSVDDVVKIPFDVRGFLPAGSSTLSSFTAGLDFDVAALGGPTALQAEMDNALRSGRPVANLAVSAVKASAPQPDSLSTRPAHPRVRLLHSNVRLHVHGWPFIDTSRARLVVASDPVSPEGVTVTSGWLLDTLWLTAEFHSSVFDEDRVVAALGGVADRMRALIG